MQFPKFKLTKSDLKVSCDKARRATSDFLYIVGIQSVRLLKRIKRRTVRFLKPLTSFCKSLFYSVVGKRIQRLKQEINYISEGISIARKRIAEAKKSGFSRVFKEYIEVTSKSFVRHKGFVFSILNVVGPIVAVFVLSMTIKYWTGLNYGLILAYDGKQVASITDERTFEQASEMVSQRMVHDTSDSKIDIDMTPSFRLSVVDAKNLSIVNAVCDKIIQQTNGIIEEASGLYVDGEFIGAVKSSADLRYILQNVLNNSKGNENNADVSFCQNVETINGFFPTTSIMTMDSMNKIITGTSKAPVTYTVKEGDTVTSIAKSNSTTISQLNKINNNQLGDNLMPGDLINLEVAVPMLSVKMVKTVDYQVPLSYKTITENDDTKYTDYSKLKRNGVNGTQQCMDKIYYINGVESKREILKRTVIKPSVDKIVVTGTKKRPNNQGSGISSGKLMWPTPSLHTITTYFTWRWGKFHTGIDISGSGAYGKTIVSADGGRVIYSGWNSGGYGYCVKVRHGNGITTLYGHASKLLVSTGQRVSKGQAIALIGSTGISTGPHLHFEVIKNGTKVNPLSYLNR